MRDKLLDLFNEIEPRTPGEVDEELRDAGLDPDEVGERMAAIARQAMISLEADLLGGASTGMPDDERIPLTLEGLHRKIQELTTLVYYATDPYIDKGDVYLIDARVADAWQVVVCHPKDLDALKAGCGPLTRWEPITNAPKGRLARLDPIEEAPRKLHVSGMPHAARGHDNKKDHG